MSILCFCGFDLYMRKAGQEKFTHFHSFIPADRTALLMAVIPTIWDFTRWRRLWHPGFRRFLVGEATTGDWKKLIMEIMMEIIEYFSTDKKEHWLSEIKESDWGAGQYLYELLKNQTLKELVGEDTKVLMLVDGENLVSFCTFAEKDDIQPTELTPWIGWIYTFPEYRGHRYAGELLRHAQRLAEEAGVKNIYISTNHTGLYEKYGYEFYDIMKDIEGEDSRVYVRRL